MDSGNGQSYQSLGTPNHDEEQYWRRYGKVLNIFCSIDMLPFSEVVNGATIILANAINFNGYWKIPFDARRTTIDTFWIDGQHSVRTDFMENTDLYYFANSRQMNAKFLRMPFKVCNNDESISFFIIDESSFC